MKDGRFEITDILKMMTGQDPFQEEVRVGRIVTGFNGLILGLEAVNQKLDDKSVYEISQVGENFILKKVGESHVDFNNEVKDISTLLITESTRLILTKREKNFFDEKKAKERQKHEND